MAISDACTFNHIWSLIANQCRKQRFSLELYSLNKGAIVFFHALVLSESTVTKNNKQLPKVTKLLSQKNHKLPNQNPVFPELSSYPNAS
jgi:hypothetical protein